MNDFLQILLFSLFMFGIYFVAGKLDLGGNYCNYGLSSMNPGKCGVTAK